MNLRDKYILDWVLKNRPDCSDSTLELMESQGVHLLMAFGFEAGRQFQADHPESNPGSCSVYSNRE